MIETRFRNPGSPLFSKYNEKTSSIENKRLALELKLTLYYATICALELDE